MIKKWIDITKNRVILDAYIIRRHLHNFKNAMNPRNLKKINIPKIELPKFKRKEKEENKQIQEKPLEKLEKPKQEQKQKKINLASIIPTKNGKKMDYKDMVQGSKEFVKESIRKARLHTKNFRNEEVRLVIRHLTNRMRVQGFVSKDDIEKICVNLNEEQYEVVFSILAKRHIEFRDGKLQYSQDYVGDREKRIQAILELISKTDPYVMSSDNIHIAKLYHESLVASNFPEQVQHGWIEGLLNQEGNMDFVINIRPTEVRSTILYMERKQKSLEDEMYQLTKLGRKDENLAKQIFVMKKRIKQVQKQEINLYSLSLYIINKSIDPDEVRKASRKTIQAMISKGIECKYATHYQGSTFRSSIPIGVDFLKGREIAVQSKALANAFIFRKVGGLK